MAAAVHGTTLVQPSEEQVHLAWRQMRNRGACPDTLEATLAHPVWSKALHGLALSLSRRSPAEPGSARPASAFVPPNPPPPARAPARAMPQRRLAFDHKRAAANDFDD